MKKIYLKAIIVLFVSTFIISLPTLASTPDGITPANEGVCDVLQADGTTKGLYGLCVAFCEAQDHASETVPITEDDLSELFESAPSGKILTKYYARKQSYDPEMPCIKVQSTCPCWSDSEFDDFASKFGQAGGINYSFCRHWEGVSNFDIHLSTILINERDPYPAPFESDQYIQSGHSTTRGATTYGCAYQVKDVDGNWVNRGMQLPQAEGELCQAQIRQRQLDDGLSCQVIP